MKKSIFVFALIAVLLAACGRGNKFEVNGKVEGATKTTKLVLEMASNGEWLAVDSTWTDDNDLFPYRQHRRAHD